MMPRGMGLRTEQNQFIKLLKLLKMLKLETV